MIKVICISKDDYMLKYLQIYDAYLIPNHVETAYMICGVSNPSSLSLIRYKEDVLPLDEYRNQQIDKIIE